MISREEEAGGEEREETSNIFSSLDLPSFLSVMSPSCIVFCRGLAAEEASAFLSLCRDRDANDAFEVSTQEKKASGPGFASELSRGNHGVFSLR